MCRMAVYGGWLYVEDGCVMEDRDSHVDDCVWHKTVEGGGGCIANNYEYII